METAMTAVQMNTRIDADLKANGDAAFANLGYSPSEAVRLFWAFAARSLHDQHALSEMIAQLKDPREVRRELLGQKEAGEWAARGPAIIRQQMQELGIRHSKTPSWSCEEEDETLSDILEADAARIQEKSDALRLANPS